MFIFHSFGLHHLVRLWHPDEHCRLVHPGGHFHPQRNPISQLPAKADPARTLSRKPDLNPNSNGKICREQRSLDEGWKKQLPWFKHCQQVLRHPEVVILAEGMSGEPDTTDQRRVLLCNTRWTDAERISHVFHGSGAHNQLFGQFHEGLPGADLENTELEFWVL